MNSTRALEILEAVCVGTGTPPASEQVLTIDADGQLRIAWVYHGDWLTGDGVDVVEMPAPVAWLPLPGDFAEFAQACRIGANIIRELQSGDSCDSTQVLSQFEKGW